VHGGKRTARGGDGARPRVGGSSPASGADGGALDPSFAIGGPAVPGYVVRVWATTLEPSYTITLQPRAPGEYFARVIVRFPHGFDEAVVTATAVAP
jgi:hypothetical protein